MSDGIRMSSPFGRTIALTGGISFLIIAYLIVDYLITFPADRGPVLHITALILVIFSVIYFIIGLYPQVLPGQEPSE